MSDTTLLKLYGIGVTPYSARGLTQTLEPIAQSQQNKRTINGKLLDLSQSQFRKYQSTITCSDQQAPAFDGVFPGQIVTVECVAELAFDEYGGPQRPIAIGSRREESGFTFYRPILEMRVTAFNISRDEYGATNGWSLSLEEV